MRRIFWIGCILAVLLAVCSFGVSAETVESATEQAAVAVVNETINETAPVAETIETVVTEIADAVDAASADLNATGNETLAPEVPVLPETEEADLINDTLVNFVKEAKNFALISGKTNALTAFNDRNGVWASPDMAIFAYDNDGVVLAYPLNLNTVGQTHLSQADPTGLRYVEQMRNAAKTGGDFVTFMAADTADEMNVKEKTAYVLPVDGSWWIGAAVFTPAPEETNEAPVVQANLTEVVPEVIEPVVDGNVTTLAA